MAAAADRMAQLENRIAQQQTMLEILGTSMADEITRLGKENAALNARIAEQAKTIDRMRMWATRVQAIVTTLPAAKPKPKRTICIGLDGAGGCRNDASEERPRCYSHWREWSRLTPAQKQADGLAALLSTDAEADEWERLAQEADAS